MIFIHIFGYIFEKVMASVILRYSTLALDNFPHPHDELFNLVVIRASVRLMKIGVAVDSGESMFHPPLRWSLKNYLLSL